MKERLEWRLVKKTRRLCYLRIGSENVIDWQIHTTGLDNGNGEHYEHVIGESF